MSPRRLAILTLVSTAALQALLPQTTLQAQTARDTLTLGRGAYERVDMEAAVRLLPVGLTAGGAASDTLWVGAVHMLTDALLSQNKDSLALFWARWATRIAPGLPIDSNVYPPRVARTLVAARTSVGIAASTDTLANTAWDQSGDQTSGRGTLRIQRGGASVLAVIEGIGTMLPGESRTLPAGSYSLRITADGYLPLTVAREVLPGYATVITPRLARPGAPGQTAAPPPSAPGGTTAGTGSAAPATNAPAVRGSTLSAAGAGSCATIEGGAAVCWGSNSQGQLGGGFTDSTRRNPVIVGGDHAFVAVSVGPSHSCALTREGRAWCWGLGTSGELGSNQTVSSAVPVPVAGSQTFVQIVAGAVHTCALSASGAVFCWGANRTGALGNRAGASSSTPTAIAAPATVTFTALAAGAGHTCALASNGAAYCWGAGGYGQLANGSTSDASAPVMAQSTVPFRSLTSGSAHSCALSAAGAAWCWGANASGQLGNNQTSDSPRPTPVAGEMTFATLEAGDTHTCGLTADGAAYCWGAGRSGQLGNGQTVDSPRPVLVVGGHVLRALGLGTGHSCGRADDGVTWCWGSNSDGQLGSLGGRSSATPVPVLVRAATRSAGGGGSMAYTVLRETFNDGNFSSGPAWSVDSANGLRATVADSAFDIARSGARGQVAAAGITLPVRIPVTRLTQIQFDVMVRSGTAGCGLNCTAFPAVMRVRARNNDLTESEVWYAFGDRGGHSHSLGSVVVVARGDAPAGTWLREQRFTIRDALPRADTILQISLGGTGADFAARFDNIFVPVAVATLIDVTPDSIRLRAVAARQPLRATVRDAAGAVITGVRIAWSSSDTAVARVDSLGVVRAVGGGSAMIRALVGEVGDSTRVIVGAARKTTPRRP